MTVSPRTHWNVEHPELAVRLVIAACTDDEARAIAWRRWYGREPTTEFEELLRAAFLGDGFRRAGRVAAEEKVVPGGAFSVIANTPPGRPSQGSLRLVEPDNPADRQVTALPRELWADRQCASTPLRGVRSTRGRNEP